MINSTFVQSRHIVDVECRYSDGVFYLGRLPSCLPPLFTVRFTAPRDFNIGDIFAVREINLAPMTQAMEEPVDKAFSAGAVMMCEIDLDRKLAFIRTSAAGCNCEEVKFQTSDLVYYIDPNGDDSPNNPGGMDSPFKTLAGAGRAAWENVVMNPLGQLIFSFNPGKYQLTAAEESFFTGATHPLGMMFTSTNSGQKAEISANSLICRSGTRIYDNLIMTSLSGGTWLLLSMSGACVLIRDVELVASKANLRMASSFIGSTLRIESSLVLNGNGYPAKTAISAHASSCIQAYDGATIAVENLPSVSEAFARSFGAYVQISGINFTGSVSGKRYVAGHNGIINTQNAGADYFPGTVAGTTSTGGLYL